MSSRFLLPLLLASALAACSNHGSATANHYVSFVDQTVVVSVHGNPDAHVGANGDLSIGSNTIAVTPSQRTLLKRYYSEAVAVRDDGIETGKAGAAEGAHAVGSVFGNLIAGTPDKIDRDTSGRDKDVEAAAQRLCGDLLQLKTTQGDVAAQLPAFGPYAVFGREINYFGGDMQCDEADQLPAPPRPPVMPQAPKKPLPPNSSASAR